MSKRLHPHVAVVEANSAPDQGIHSRCMSMSERAAAGPHVLNPLRSPFMCRRRPTLLVQEIAHHELILDGFNLV